MVLKFMLNHLPRIARNLLLFSVGGKGQMATRKSKTHFQQIPVEAVKKIAQQQAAKKEDGGSDLVLEGSAGKTDS